MKKHYLFVVLAMLLAFSASAEQVVIHCRNCGKIAVTEKDVCPSSWSYYKGDYFCNKKKCKENLEFRIENAQLIADAGQMLDNQEKWRKIEIICPKLKSALLSLQGETDTQISTMKQTIDTCVKAKCNAIDIWEVFVAYADFDAVKYFWPDPADKNVYLTSKKQMEANERKKNQWVRTSWKVEPGAFALGRSKKDNSIRLVDNEKFAIEILGTAMAHGRSDVVSYLLKQSQGLTPELASGVIEKWVKTFTSLKVESLRIEKELSAAQKNRKVADDELDAAKIDKQIADLKRQLDAANVAPISDEVFSSVAGSLTPYLAADCYFSIEAWVKDGAPRNYKEEMSSSLTPSIRKSLDKVFANASGELGEWYKWRTELKKDWRPGIVDKWIYTLKTGDKVDEWIWIPGLSNDNGWISAKEPFGWKRESGLMSSAHPGYSSDWFCSESYEYTLKWKWTPGCQDITRAGYFAGDKEGEFYWKAGVPDPKRVGLVSGDKEGEFVISPGFKKQEDGQIRWTPGLPHPQYPGIISAEKMFSWIPDKDHYWANDKYGFDTYNRQYYLKRMEPEALFKTEKDCDVACGVFAEIFKDFIRISGTPTQDMFSKDKE